jgi:exodeoxyribonuclease V alpha subunit
MKYIKGKVRQLIFESESGYKVGLFRIKETDDEEMQDFINKTITFVGYFADLNKEDNYMFNGSLVYNEKYGYQYKVDNYEHMMIEGIDAVKEFLSSPLIKGCGDKTADAIVKTLGDKALDLIKNNYNNLLMVPGMTEKKALKIYDSITKYQSTDDMILNFKKMGFSINESLAMINKSGNNALENFKANPYAFKDVVDFKKIDDVYIKLNDMDINTRNQACFEEVFHYLEMDTGNTYFNEEEVLDGLKKFFSIILTKDSYDNFISELTLNNTLIKNGDKLFLTKTYNDELSIASNLNYINSLPVSKYTIFDTEIIKLQEDLNVKYNEEQLNAIRSALESRISIITGGPGTGKTTIVKAITKLYKILHKLNEQELSEQIALLAPTGRASKKLSEATGLGASTIHRFLKWNKDTNDFQINEMNPNYQKLIIVDETSMIDTSLFAALLNGLTKNIQLVLVGDANQLPSVGPGIILSDLINSNLFTYSPLYQIYRQSNNSYIPILASEIKDKSLSEAFTTQKDDYNFLEVRPDMIKSTIKKICEMSIQKGLNERDLQILIPMYKGENGIDNINMILQELFNPKEENKKEIKIGDVIYREGDKILQLVNDPDNQVFNGDIGYIEKIISLKTPRKEDLFLIDYDGINVEYKREDMMQVKHAYAITIHKSQGSEFQHVIMPITKNYYKMLYNKLVYTGVSRAKKSLVIIGEKIAFKMAVNNSYADNRHTDLLDKLLNNL